MKPRLGDRGGAAMTLRTVYTVVDGYRECAHDHRFEANARQCLRELTKTGYIDRNLGRVHSHQAGPNKPKERKAVL